MTWDGALCWDPTASGTEARQACPAYVREMNAGTYACICVKRIGIHAVVFGAED